MDHSKLEYFDEIVYTRDYTVFLKTGKSKRLYGHPLHIHTDYFQKCSILDKHFTAMSCNTKQQFVIIGNNGNANKYNIGVLDKNLDKIDSYQRFHKKGKRLIDILKEEVGRLNFNAESVIEIYGERVVLPYDATLVKTVGDTVIYTPETRDCDRILNICYNKYQHNLVLLINMPGPIYYFEYWKRIDNNWVMQRRSDPVSLCFASCELSKWQLSQVYHLECGRYQILLGILLKLNNTTIGNIMTFDVETFACQYSVLGTHPTHLYDYEIWYKNGLDILHKIESMPMSDDLLSLILSYVG